MATVKKTPEPSPGTETGSAVPEETVSSAPPPASGPTQGELDEAIAEKEQAQAETMILQAQLEEMKQRMDRWERIQAGKPAYTPTGVDARSASAEDPVFDETRPHGTVTGVSNVAYVQDGHQFGRDRQYIATELHRGNPRPFNPRLVGFVRPRPGLAAEAA